MGFWPLWDDLDYVRESREFHRDLQRDTDELPDVSSERAEWLPDNRPLGRIGRRVADTYVTDWNPA